MTIDQGIAALAAAIIVTAAGFFGGMITAKQKNDELLLLAIQHLCGGTQERNVGISAIELYWNKNRHRELCISMLIGSAIYLLGESKQKDAQHELYNLNRIMQFLLTKKKLYSAKHPVLIYYKSLDAAFNDALANIESNATKETGENKQEVRPKHGLWVNKVQLETWHKQLNLENQMSKPEEGQYVSNSNSNSITKASILEKYAARISSLKNGFRNTPKYISINKDEPANALLTADNNEWWYCLEGNGKINITNKGTHFLQPNGIVVITKGTKFTTVNNNKMPLQLLVFNQ